MFLDVVLYTKYSEGVLKVSGFVVDVVLNCFCSCLVQEYFLVFVAGSVDYSEGVLRVSGWFLVVQMLCLVSSTVMGA